MLYSKDEYQENLKTWVKTTHQYNKDTGLILLKDIQHEYTKISGIKMTSQNFGRLLAQIIRELNDEQKWNVIYKKTSNGQRGYCFLEQRQITNIKVTGLEQAPSTTKKEIPKNIVCAQTPMINNININQNPITDILAPVLSIQIWQLAPKILDKMIEKWLIVNYTPDENNKTLIIDLTKDFLYFYKINNCQPDQWNVGGRFTDKLARFLLSQVWPDKKFEKGGDRHLNNTFIKGIKRI